MIEWIEHWDEMRFYYWSGLSWIMILPVYVAGVLLLGGLSWLFAKVFKRTWVVLAAIIVLLPVLAIAPWWEELNIAWNFGQLCKKDAGIFITKTVEVEGFYDATAELLEVPIPVTKQAADYYDKAGYRIYEMVLRNVKGGPNKVVHLKKVKGVWTATVLDHPTARYRYEWPSLHAPVSHKVVKHERVVVDTKSGEILGRDLEYGRKAPWFFIGLDAPLMLCPEQHPLTKYGAIYNIVLKPIAAK